MVCSSKDLGRCQIQEYLSLLSAFVNKNMKDNTTVYGNMGLNYTINMFVVQMAF